MADINLLDESKAVVWNNAEKSGCFNRCVEQLEKHGVKRGSTVTADKRFQLLIEKVVGGKRQLVYADSNPKETYKKGIEIIDRHLNARRPIIVGINHTIGYRGGINEGATDHFVTICGRKQSGQYVLYRYYENARGTKKEVCNEKNTFIYDPSGHSFYNANYHRKGNKKRVDVTQIRPNDGGAGSSGNGGGTTAGGVAVTNGGGNVTSIDGTSQDLGTVSGLGEAGTEGGSSLSSYVVQSYSSFGIQTIFGEVFPEDDNNRYIDMGSEDIAIVQYTEPVLKVDELKISSKHYTTSGIYPDKISFHTPVVYINDYMITQTNITNFCLDYSSFVPQVMVEFVDFTNELLSSNIPKPGYHIKVYIGGNGDEKYYKPIRQDFIITNIIKSNKTGGDYQNLRNPIKYKLTGMLNVPLGFRKMPWSSSKINARQAMFNISNTVGLGFATNFNTNSETDVMRWVNVQSKSYYDFMKEIAQHSCYSPYTFFTAFIDQYYVLNYVECRRLLSHGGKKTDMPQMIYSCVMPEMENKEKHEFKSGEQKLSYYFLSNSDEFKGWTNYIEEYFELNDGYSVMSDGYIKNFTYSDACGFPNLMSKHYRFLLTPVDNLKRDENKNIMSLPSDFGKDTYIPLNLRQTTNYSYTDSEKLYDNPAAAESSMDIGEVDTSNNFPLYFYASAQNNFQMNNLKKCGLSVRLENYNPSITRYSRIWIDIYDKHENSKTNIRKNLRVDKMQDSDVKKYIKEKNDNIIIYKEEQEKDNEYQVYNRSLSGWYVVTDMKIMYNTTKDFRGSSENTYKKLQMQLVLNRIDYKPSFRSEYEMAKKTVEKYKSDNIAENIMQGGDIMQGGGVDETQSENSTQSENATQSENETQGDAAQKENKTQ